MHIVPGDQDDQGDKDDQGDQDNQDDHDDKMFFFDGKFFQVSPVKNHPLPCIFAKMDLRKQFDCFVFN